MRISGKKQDALYNAFASKIMDLRVELKQDRRLREDEALDSRLFKLEGQIWDGVKKALDI